MNLAMDRESVKKRREHLGCLCDHWPGESDLERYGNAMEKMLLIGLAYGYGGPEECGRAARLLDLPLSHAKVVIDILVGMSP